MMAPIPVNEQERLAALATYKLLDSDPEQTFQDLVQLAAQVFQVPIALVSLVDQHRQWFKARIGIDMEQTPRDVAFCAHTILGTEILLVPDACADTRFAASPLVTSEPFIRFYAGAPLISPEGYALGALSLMDRVPRTLTPEQQSSLRILADQVMSRIELRHRVREVEQMAEERAQIGTRLKGLIACVQSGVLVEDENRRILLANTEFCRLFHIPVPPETLVGVNCADMAAESMRLVAEPDQFVQMITETLAARQPVTNLSIPMADGRVYERDYVPFFVQDTYRGHLWMYRDVTERAQNLTVLRENEERIRLILDSAMDAVVTVNLHGIIIDWNRQAEVMFGWSRAEAIGQPFFDLIIPPEFHDEYRRAMHRFVELSNGPVLHQRVEITGLRRDRQEFTAELSPVPVKTANSFAVTAFFRDITERQQAEEALALALEKAEQASRLKSEFVASVSHEIRTPLNGVIGMTDLLLDTQLTPAQRELAETAHTAAESLLELINDVLDFSKIEAGKLVVQPASFDLQAVVEEVAGILVATVEARGLKLIVEYAPDVPRHLIGDAGRIRQILVNLVGNAVKFTQQGHVLVRVECPHTTSHMAQMRVSVEDTGIGISADNLQKIFTQFTQASASNSRHSGGTGLGLTISKQLAHLMGGTLEVNSMPDEGSIFTLTIDLPLDWNVPPAPPVELRGQRVLIIEDHIINQRVLRDYVTHWGGEWTCCGGVTALNELRAAVAAGYPYDLTIMGHCLPVADRLRIGRAIKTDPTLAQVTLIILTMMGRPNHFVNFQARYADHLIKATRPSALMERLLMRQRNEQAPVRSSPRRPRVPTNEIETPVLLSPLGTIPRILIVDDNTINQRVVQLMLERAGYPADAAASGRIALDMLDRVSYDLILMDCQMPEMDGYETTRRIRSLEQGKGQIPIIALTAGVMQGEREKCLAAGMDEYLAKPVLTNDLLGLLQRYLPLTEPPPMSAANTVNAELPFPFSALTSRIGEEYEQLSAFARLFQEETSHLLATCRQAAAADDGEALRGAAHALKGVLLILDAEQGAKLAQSLELHGQQTHLPDIEDLLMLLEAELARVMDYLSTSAAAAPAPPRNRVSEHPEDED